LDSYNAITSSSGKVIQRNHFDVWGNPLPVYASTDTLKTTPLNFTLTNRGFTGHEHYPELKIINMNGRLYDPVIARFFSPDKYVVNSTFTQDFNRYTYARNNPLKYKDPTGHYYQDYDDDRDDYYTLNEINCAVNRVTDFDINAFNNYWDGMNSIIDDYLADAALMNYGGGGNKPPSQQQRNRAYNAHTKAMVKAEFYRLVSTFNNSSTIPGNSVSGGTGDSDRGHIQEPYIVFYPVNGSDDSGAPFSKGTGWGVALGTTLWGQSAASALQGASNADAAFKFLKTISKGAKIGGVAGGVFSTGVAIYDFSNEKSLGNALRIGVQGAALGTAVFIPGVGWVISLGITTADYFWGDDFYNWIDKKHKK